MHMPCPPAAGISACFPLARVIRTHPDDPAEGGVLTLSDYDLQVKMVGSPILQAQIIFKASLN